MGIIVHYPSFITQLCATDQYVVKWYMNQFDDVSYGAHDEKSNTDSSGDVDELAIISCNMSTMVRQSTEDR